MEVSTFAFFTDEPCGRVISSRLEVVSIEDLDSRHVHQVQLADDASEESCTCVVLERATGDPSSLDVATRIYSCHASVADFLATQADPSLVEDAEILRLAVASSAANNAHQLNVRRIRPLEQENALLRAALGIPKKERVSVATLKRCKRQSTKSNELSVINADSVHSQVSQHVDQSDACIQTGETTADQPTPKVEDALSIHSPLLWEQETLAAINARTKYSPFVTRHKGGARKLDLVTQQNLVTRLHDQCVDERQRKMLLNEEKILRDLGLYERRVLSQDEQAELGARLHDRQRVHTAEVLKKLTTEFHGDHSPARVMTPAEIQQSNERIYTQPLEKAKEAYDKLFHKYVLDEEVKHAYGKLSLEKQKEVADRLTKR